MEKMLILAVVFLLNWGAHWMPWSVIPTLATSEGRMKRVPAYIFGVLSIIIGFGLWTMDLRMVVDLVVLAVAAGAGAVLPRLVRAWREYQALKGDVADYEQAITG